MVQTLDLLKETPSQTAGPYVHIGCTPNFAGIENIYPDDPGTAMTNDKTKGERITIKGHIIDGAGTPLKDAMVEIWQADAEGFYNSTSETRGEADPNFAGWGRCATNMKDGSFILHTIKPGAVPMPRYGDKTGIQAPHILFWIVARGINLGLCTRMYFPEEEEANAACPVLAKIEHTHRIETLIATQRDENYTFDIHLQGERETVFFAI